MSAPSRICDRPQENWAQQELHQKKNFFFVLTPLGILDIELFKAIATASNIADRHDLTISIHRLLKYVHFKE